MHENLHIHVFSLFFIFLFFNIHSVKSEIQTIKISSDNRPFILFEDFGFSNPGYISVSISSISIATEKSITTPTILSLMGCFYGPSPARQAIKRALLKDICVMGNPFVFPIFTFNDQNPVSPQTRFNKTVLVTIPDLYYIFFLNCAKNSSVSMKVNLETYNVGPNGDPDYIDEHFTNLPTTLFIFSLLFFLFLLTWSYTCNKNKHFIHRLHLLMALLLLLKFLELICYANSQRSIKRNRVSPRLERLWLAIYFARNVLFIVVIVLIRAGWSFSRPCLQELQKYTISTAISLQIVASICFILIHGVGPSHRQYRYWTITYYAVDFLCCVTMLLPLSKYVEHLDGNMKIEGKEGKRMVHKRVFGNFALALCVYFGFTRIGIFVLRSITSHDLWCLTIALELAYYSDYVIVTKEMRKNINITSVVLHDSTTVGNISTDSTRNSGNISNENPVVKDVRKDLASKPKYLVTFTVGYDQRNNIDEAVKKVRLRCRREWTMFQARMDNAEKAYYKSVRVDPSNFTGHR
ncbi:hypothetical protein DH2020_049662 [Rehmannia glutinosa]|uniref:Uncharacterized protein n=1 Tax=Rehmannia glutinosa TaxID=99300 RepID=A0ABR0U222_REHGL